MTYCPEVRKVKLAKVSCTVEMQDYCILTVRDSKKSSASKVNAGMRRERAVIDMSET